MFCPTCGAHQSGDRKFCTSCGQNLLLVSQALGGQLPFVPPHQRTVEERNRQQDIAKGVKLTIIGGAFLAIQIFGFIFTLPFRGNGSPFGFFSLVALVMMAIGISKLVNARSIIADRPAFTPSVPNHAVPSMAPQLHVSEAPAHPDAPVTGELVDAPHPAPSVTEEDTQHLPGLSSTNQR